jgi:hypothetical protein
MNMLTQNPDFAIRIARQTIDDRIHDAQHRAQVRTIRAERRATHLQSRATRGMPTPDTAFPLFVLRLFRPARGTN